MLTKVLMLSRLDSEDTIQTQHADNIDLASLLAERVAEHAPRAVQMNMDLGLQHGPAVALHGSQALLVTAIDNLIDNALRYCPSGTKIDVSWSEDWVAVEDNGPGIAQQDRERVFTRFERGNSASETTGSGLGLAIARTIARQHGGDLHLEPTASDKGCRFVLRLPA